MGRISRQAHADKAEFGLHNVKDTPGLYLRKGANGAGSWLYRYSFGGKRREMGLGPLASTPLLEAREKARACAVQRDNGHDPIEMRRREKPGNVAKALLEKRIKLDPMTTPDLTHVYRHYDVNGRLLYVGVAQSTHNRLQQHRKQTVWFPLTALITIDDYPSRKAAEIDEARAILIEKPLYNRVVRVDRTNADQEN
jgi:hypothetical protein